MSGRPFLPFVIVFFSPPSVLQDWGGGEGMGDGRRFRIILHSVVEAGKDGVF